MTQRGSEPEQPDQRYSAPDPAGSPASTPASDPAAQDPGASDQADSDRADSDRADSDRADSDRADSDQTVSGEELEERVDPGDPSGLRSVTEIRKPSTLGGIIYLAVLAGALVGVVVAATGAWRSGVSWIALAVLAAAGARLALSDDDAGMLQVRRKAFDATILVAMGVTLLVLVASIPEQPS